MHLSKTLPNLHVACRLYKYSQKLFWNYYTDFVNGPWASQVINEFTPVPIMLSSLKHTISYDIGHKNCAYHLSMHILVYWLLILHVYTAGEEGNFLEWSWKTRRDSTIFAFNLSKNHFSENCDDDTPAVQFTMDSYLIHCQIRINTGRYDVRRLRISQKV